MSRVPLLNTETLVTSWRSQGFLPVEYINFPAIQSKHCETVSLDGHIGCLLPPGTIIGYGTYRSALKVAPVLSHGIQALASKHENQHMHTWPGKVSSQMYNSG